MAYAVLRRTVFPLLNKFYSEIDGLEQLPKHQPFIVAANHVGLIDYFFIAAALTRCVRGPLHFITKRLWFRDVFLKRWWGQIAVDPDRPAACLDEARRCLQQGEVVVFFPEGTASGNGSALLPAKHGAARLALQTGMPVVPFGFVGPERAGKYFLSLRNMCSLFFFYKKVRLHIGQSLYFTGRSGGQTDQAHVSEVSRTIMTAIARLTGKTYQY